MPLLFSSLLSPPLACQLAAPSLHLPSETDDYGDGYPFSVEPDQPLTPQVRTSIGGGWMG